MIDVRKPIFFYDDRDKDDILLELEIILFQNDEWVLCKIKDTDIEEPFLFKIENGEVINSLYYSYVATDDMNFIQELRERYSIREDEQAEWRSFREGE